MKDAIQEGRRGMATESKTRHRRFYEWQLTFALSFCILLSLSWGCVTEEKSAKPI